MAEIKPIRIGALTLDSNLLLAPLCGCTNLPTRLFARMNGAALVFTEMAKAEAIVRNNRKSMQIMRFEQAERPVGIQISGGDPELMADTARRVTELNPDLIDINMGCPVKKIISTEAGCALLKDPAKAYRVVKAVVDATHLPVTCKIRIGWDECNITVSEMGRAVEDAGGKLLTIHARTKAQLFSGKADWTWIAKVKQELKIPVVGNGDVKTPADAKRMLDETGCDGVMIGRAALGNPWIFRDAEQYIRTGTVPPRVDDQAIYDMMERHFNLMCRIEGDAGAVFLMRRHACWYIEGRRGARAFRNAFNAMTAPADFFELLGCLRRGELPRQPVAA